jgi:hypothetical protein
LVGGRTFISRGLADVSVAVDALGAATSSAVVHPLGRVVTEAAARARVRAEAVAYQDA